MTNNNISDKEVQSHETLKNKFEGYVVGIIINISGLSKKYVSKRRKMHVPMAW